jgi:hypothetical protein
MIKHLLLIAGPSGAGKTTFMDQLAAGQLRAEIVARLPAGAGSWVQSSCKRFLQQTSKTHDAEGRLKPLPGLVLHYDIMRPHSLGMSDHAADAALRTPFGLADEVAVVSLLPAADRLSDQFSSRVTTARLETADWDGRLKAFRHWMRGQRLASLKKPQQALLERYRQPGWVEHQYARWLDHLAACRREFGGMTVIMVEGGLDEDGHPSFRLSPC